MSIRGLGWPAIGAMLCALASAVIIVTRRFELILGSFPLQLLGLALLAIALWQSRRWWLLILALPLAFPLMLWIELWFQCARGNCL